MSPPRKALRQTRFKNERLDPIGAELMSLAELRGRVPATQLLQTERVEFFMVLVATGGRGRAWRSEPGPAPTRCGGPTERGPTTAVAPRG